MATKKHNPKPMPAALAAAFEKAMVGRKKTCKHGHRLTVENVRRSKLMHGAISCLACFVSYAGHAGGGKKKAKVAVKRVRKAESKKRAAKPAKKIVAQPTRPAVVPVVKKPSGAPIPPQAGFASQR
jgi:hypothetical protein